MLQMVTKQLEIEKQRELELDNMYRWELISFLFVFRYHDGEWGGREKVRKHGGGELRSMCS